MGLAWRGQDQIITAPDQVANKVIGPQHIYGLPPTPYCRVRNTANQAIANNTDTALTFDTDTADPFNMHSVSSNTSRINILVTGWYRVTGAVDFANNTTGYRTIYLRWSGGGGTIFQAYTAVAGATANESQIFVSGEYAMTVGTYVEVYVSQSSGGSLNSLTNGDIGPNLTVSWVTGLYVT